MRLRLLHRSDANDTERVLRCVAVHRGICPGSHILLAGNCDEQIVRGLISLGCLVTLDVSSETDADDLQKRYPEAECSPAVAASSQFSARSVEFDLVAAFPGSEPFQSNLLTPQAMTATAALIGCLKPGGVYLMFPGVPSAPRFQRHSTRCCVQHLSSLVAAAQQTNTVLRCESSHAPLSEMASVTTPPVRKRVEDWAVIARQAASRQHEFACCGQKAPRAHVHGAA